jgi:N4-bis(aminopropyl)spermidine synthase
VEALARYVAGYAAAARPLRQLVALLTEAAYPLDELVRETALPRRTVEDVLTALGPDLVDGRIRPDLVPAYRARFGYPQLRATALADPLAARLADAAGLVADAGALIAAAPRPAAALDHVSATATTAVRRALWLDSVYDLAGAHLLCLGDHDLTSVLVAAVNPDVTITVVDLDERVLAYVDSVAAQRKYRIRCLFGDLRFGLPGPVTGRADLVFTDPPYTPEGVRLFLARGLRALRDREHGRLLMAYGFSARHPALGWQVQQAAAGLGLVYEAVLPGFSRYLGAQAVGSASDLYVCRPTGRTVAPVPSGTGIYTHGAQSTEAPVARADPEALCGLAGPGAVLAEPGAVLASARTFTGPVALDLTADPGPWLPRVLLAVNAVCVAVLVSNRHPDVSTQRGQEALAALVGPKYRLTYLRNTPDNRSTVVLALRTSRGTSAADRLLLHILDRAHGKVANVWRDGLVKVAGLTREGATALVDADPDVSLLDLPRHRIEALLARAAESGAREGVQARESATSTLPRIAAE